MCKRFLPKKQQEKRVLGRPGHRLEVNIKISLKEINV
jgi:hypothetical protein